MSDSDWNADHVRRRLAAALDENALQLRALRGDHRDMVAATADANTDDEHDPEGATIAFERQQISALIDGARATRERLVQALARCEAGTYGSCSNCGGAIAPERLDARPDAVECMVCARGTRR